jgi:hypothetical protein
VPAAATSELTYISGGSADADLLARSLEAAAALTCPDPPPTETWAWEWADPLAAWDREIATLPISGRVVVCTWLDPAPSLPLIDIEPRQWRQEVEWPTALWFATLVAAAGRCRDGGALVVVVDRPATLDAVGHTPAILVADGVSNVVRSLAAREGGRGVRVNAVVTSRGTAPDELSGSPPPLATFPGRIDVEVAGAVRALLSPEAVGITGSTVAATCGRR